MSTYVPKCKICGRPQQEGQGWQYRRHYRGDGYVHETCPVQVCKQQVKIPGSFNDRHPCGKTAKGQTDAGEWLCGIHLAAWKRRQKHDQESRSRWTASDANMDRAKVAVEVLAELGLRAAASYDSIQKRYNGHVSLDPQELFRVLGIGVQLPEIR